MIDTHTHIYLDDFDDDRDAVIQRALDAGVSHLVFPNVDVSTIEPMLALHGRYPGQTSVAIGLHPTEVYADYIERLAEIGKALDSRDDWCAIGEVGIDLYWDKSFRNQQMDAFSRQLDWAARRRLPVIIHCREGLDETLECLAGADKAVEPVFHCFSGDDADVRRVLDVAPSAMFGIGGVVTFKNAEPLRRAVAEAGLGRLLLETDSPYLAPVPHRGKRNESAFLPAVASKIADVLGVSPREVERVTDASARRIFKF